MSDATKRTVLTMEEAGYLSGEAVGIRDDIRRAYGHLLGQCAVASRTAMAILGKGVVGPPHVRAGLAAWVRSISACQAAVVLAERGMVAEACAILRTGYEHLFFAGALLRDPAVLDRMRDQDTKERQKTMRSALNDPDVDSVITPEQRAALHRALETPAGKLSISAFDAAKVAGLAGIFQTTYRQLSQVGTHANATSVGNTFGASLAEVQFLQSPLDLPQVLAHIAGCLQIGSGAFLAVQDAEKLSQNAPTPPEVRV
ncbi:MULTISPECIES: DUF5677 domain-containing protein [Cupriavidus]